MDINTIRMFFMWCSVINGAVLILSSLILVFGGSFVFRVHTRWFVMPRETFNAVVYGFLGFYKVVFITFNLVPCLALSIIG